MFFYYAYILIIFLINFIFFYLRFLVVYELWVKLSIFLCGVSFNYDEIIVKLLYSEISKLAHDKKCLYLDDEPYEKTFLQDILTNIGQCIHEVTLLKTEYYINKNFNYEYTKR